PEHVILQLDALVDRHVVLNAAVPAHARTIHHDNVLSKAAPLADDRARHDVAEMPDLGAATDAGTLVHIGRFVNEDVAHGHAPRRRWIAPIMAWHGVRPPRATPRRRPAIPE